MNIKYLLLKIKKRFLPNMFNSEDYIKPLKMDGIKIGKGTYFFGIASTVIDTQRPCLLEIGEYCKITAGVKILTHDYSRSVLRRKYGDVIGEAKKTTIKNNVFIGMNSIILPGACIGNNVIIGAGSIVSGNIPDDVVIAGNPAKIIRSIEEHYQIRKSKYIEEAKNYARYLSEKGIKPTIQNMGEFFPIYLERNKNELVVNKINTKLNGDNEKDIIDNFLKSKPIYKNFDEFIKDCNL